MLIPLLFSLALLQPVSGGPIVGHAADDDPFAAIASSASRNAARRCAPLLERQVGGTLSAIQVSSRAQGRSRTVIRGTIRVFLRPLAAPPGEATPAHIVNARFAYRCTLSGVGKAHATVTRLPG